MLACVVSRPSRNTRVRSSKLTFMLFLSPNGCTCMRLRMVSILVTLPPTRVVFPLGTGGTSSRGSPGLFSGSSSGLVAGDETAGVLWPAGTFCEAAAFWLAGVLFLLAPVSDCVGGVPLWANACDIANSKVRTRGTGLFTQTAPGRATRPQLVLPEMLLELAEFAP